MEILSVNTSKGEVRCAKCCSGSRSLVMLPGISIGSILNSAADVEAAYRAFDGKYTIYLFEYPGRYPDGAEISYLAELLAEAIRLLGLKDCCLFGASFGGMIGQALLAEHPELFSAAVLGSTVAKLTAASPETISRWYALALSGDVRSLNLAFYDAVYSDELQIGAAAAIRKALDIGTENDCRMAAEHLGMILRADLRSCAQKIKTRTLVIGAKNDRVFSCEDIAELAELIGGKLYLYEGSSHAAFDEEPDYQQRMLAHFAGEGGKR